jgi:hypothetical protein
MELHAVTSVEAATTEQKAPAWDPVSGGMSLLPGIPALWDFSKDDHHMQKHFINKEASYKFIHATNIYCYLLSTTLSVADTTKNKKDTSWRVLCATVRSDFYSNDMGNLWRFLNTWMTWSDLGFKRTILCCERRWIKKPMQTPDRRWLWLGGYSSGSIESDLILTISWR